MTKKTIQTHASGVIREQWLKRMIRACMVSSRVRQIYSVQSKNNKHTQKQGLLREGLHRIIQGPPGPPQLPNYLSSKVQINLFPRPPLSSHRVSLIPMSSVPTHVNSMSSHHFSIIITISLSKDMLSKEQTEREKSGQ